MLMDRLRACRPSYVRAIAPYQPGKPIAELARELGLDEATIVKLASNENPLGVGPRTRAAIDAALADLARYPDGNGFELKQALVAALRRRHGARSCSATARTTCSSWWRARSSRPGASAVYLAARVRGLSAGDAGARRARDRGAGDATTATTSTRWPRAIDDETRVVFVANPNNPTGTFVRRERARGVPARGARATCSWCSTRRTTNTCRRTCAADTRGWLERYPEPGRHAHVLQGLRARGPARRLRARARRRRRSDEPRAPAVQREQPRAGRGGGGARRHGVRRAQLRRQRCRACAQLDGRARSARASSTFRRSATSSPSRVGRRPREVYQRLLQQRRDRAAGRAATACPSTCASRSALPSENARFLAALAASARRTERVTRFERVAVDRRRPDRRLVRAGAEAGAGACGDVVGVGPQPRRTCERALRARRHRRDRRRRRRRRRATPISC